jgi:RNA polymerase sigma factor (sigma-70 family)
VAEGLTFAELMRRLEAGDEDAASEVFRLYARRLIGLARAQIESRFRGVLSGSDVAQEVLNSFFRRQAAEPFDVDNEDALWGLLAEITFRKCNRWNRRLSARKRGGRLASWQATDLSDAEWQAIDSAPRPDDAAVLTDTLAELYGGLKEQECRICELRLQNYKVREIAAQVNLTEETVSRKLGRIKDKLQRLCAAGE